MDRKWTDEFLDSPEFMAFAEQTASAVLGALILRRNVIKALVVLGYSKKDATKLATAIGSAAWLATSAVINAKNLWSRLAKAEDAWRAENVRKRKADATREQRANQRAEDQRYMRGAGHPGT